MLRLFAFVACLLPAGTAAAQSVAPLAALSAPPRLGVAGPRHSMQLSAGVISAGQLGSASYVGPQLSYRLTPRLTVFGGATYLRVVPNWASGYAYADGQPRPWNGINRLLMQGGAQYAVSPRLALTATAWKDLSGQVPGGSMLSPYAGFGGRRSGMGLRADYLITKNFSISGGLRMSNSAFPGGAVPWYTPGLGYPGGF